MARGKLTFRQADVSRAIRAAIAAGLPIARVEIAPDGRIVVVAGKAAEAEQPAASNEWDDAV